MLSIGKLAIQLTTPLLLRKPCKLFASVAWVCHRQLGFLVETKDKPGISCSEIRGYSEVAYHLAYNFFMLR